MASWRALTTVGGLLLLCTAVVAASGCMSNEPSGPRSTYAYVPVRSVDAETLERAANVLEARAEELGLEDVEARVEDGRILVELPGGPGAARHVRALGRNPRIAVYDLEGQLAPRSLEADGLPRGVRARPAAERVVVCDRSAVVCPGVPELPPQKHRWYYVFGSPPKLSAADFELDRTKAVANQETGRPFLVLTMSHAGLARFQPLAREVGRRTQRGERLQHVAIVIDGELRVWPAVVGTKATGVDRGKITVSGFESIPKVFQIAALLRGGVLPVELEPTRVTG